MVFAAGFETFFGTFWILTKPILAGYWWKGSHSSPSALFSITSFKWPLELCFFFWKDKCWSLQWESLNGTLVSWQTDSHVTSECVTLFINCLAQTPPSWTDLCRKRCWQEAPPPSGPAAISLRRSGRNFPGNSSPGTASKRNWSYHGNWKRSGRRCACGSSRCSPSVRTTDGPGPPRRTDNRTGWRCWPTGTDGRVLKTLCALSQL